MKKWLCDMNKARKRRIADERPFTEDELTPMEAQYTAILRRGQAENEATKPKWAMKDEASLLRRLEKYRDSHVSVAGEITSKHEPNIKALVYGVLYRCEPSIRNDFDLITNISKQSGDIALGVDKKGAGDQGMMFGYATQETSRMLPLPFMLATQAIYDLYVGSHPALLPDAKAQVTYDYRKRRIDTFLISTQHKEDVDPQDVFHQCKRVMDGVAESYHLNKDFRALVNPTGRFVTGGSFADTGVTGRKIMCDTYGGAAHHAD